MSYEIQINGIASHIYHLMMCPIFECHSYYSGGTHAISAVDNIFLNERI